MANTMLMLLRIVVPLLAGLMLGAATPPPTPVQNALTSQDQHDLRCAAAFAVIAVAQTRGDAAALALPALAIRGKRYMGLVGERLAGSAGLSGETLANLLVNAARSVTQNGAPDVAVSCLGDLDRVVPPTPAPDAVTCVAMLDIYAHVLATRNPADPLAVILQHEAASLTPAAQALLGAKGLDPAAAAAAIDLERRRVREALTGGHGSLDADDFARCRHLAAAPTG